MKRQDKAWISAHFFSEVSRRVAEHSNYFERRLILTFACDRMGLEHLSEDTAKHLLYDIVSSGQHKKLTHILTRILAYISK
jgi:hypothetical protein